MKSIPARIVGVALAATGWLFAEEPPSDKITEHDKQVFRNFIDGRKNRTRLAVAIINAKQIGLALFEFDSEYGRFPAAETVPMVTAAAGKDLNLKADTANDCFYQLIAAKIVETDRMFSVKKAEEQAEPEAKPPAALEICDFAYLSGMSAAGPPSRPIAVAPLVPGKTVFDPKPFGGKAIILRVDNSVSALPFGEDGRVLVDGHDIFDPQQPFWAGKLPPIKWPKP